MRQMRVWWSVLNGDSRIVAKRVAIHGLSVHAEQIRRECVAWLRKCDAQQ